MLLVVKEARNKRCLGYSRFFATKELNMYVELSPDQRGRVNQSPSREILASGPWTEAVRTRSAKRIMRKAKLAVAKSMASLGFLPNTSPRRK